MKKISFITEDNIKLDGLLYESEILSKEVVISIHGMSSNCFKKREDILASEMTKHNISYFCFNNRGHDLTVYIDKYIDGKRTKIISGSIYEDVLDSYYDIKGAIKSMLDIGYEKIHLQGHSLGCTKIVYTYNRLKKENNTEILNKISSVILLSLVDIVDTQKYFLDDKYDQMLEYATQKEKENKSDELMPKSGFIHPISVKTYLRYFKYNKEINFSRYNDEIYSFEELNNISAPLFMRWGNDKEMIIQDVKELVKFIYSKVNNVHKNIGYIDGANHGYDGKELILASEILNFLNH
jgi:pimeloyl-ACP methyl ester carboxylesterase